MNLVQSCFFLISFVLLIGCKSDVDEADKKINPLPNIVIIFTDDQGYNDLGCFGSPDIRTPHIDRLANEGVRYTSFYTAQPVCTASRASLLTGCYPNRLGMHGALMPDVGKGLHKDEKTLPEILKEVGYRTAIFGKWHLGAEEQFNPLNHGFDHFYGIPYSNDMWPLHPWQGTVFDFPPLPLYEDLEVIDTLEDQSMLTTSITEKAVSFIKSNKENPFFLYVPHPQPHVPLFVSDRFSGKSSRGIYGDVIEEIDWSTGEIMKTLEENELSENTLVIFASDNGPWLSYGSHSGSAYPLREGKGTNWEGGVRIPCVMRFPNILPSGMVVNTPLMTIDLLPTIAKIVEGELPEHKIDGLDVIEVMKGNSILSPHDAYYFYYHVNELQAVLSGEYKLVLPHRYRTLNGRQGREDGVPIDYEYNDLTLPELYQLKDDPEERNDLSKSDTLRLSQMLKYADRMRSDLGDALLGIEGSGHRLPGKIPAM